MAVVMEVAVVLAMVAVVVLTEWKFGDPPMVDCIDHATDPRSSPEACRTGLGEHRTG